MDFELWKHSDRFRASETTIQCPRCNRRLAAIDYHTTGIAVDYCGECRGAWLDAREFEKIIAALTEELTTKTASQYVTATLEEAREILRGPESFISEWRDFLTVLRMLQYRVLAENPQLSRAVAEIQRSSPIR